MTINPIVLKVTICGTMQTANCWDQIFLTDKVLGSGFGLEMRFGFGIQFKKLGELRKVEVTLIEAKQSETAEFIV